MPLGWRRGGRQQHIALRSDENAVSQDENPSERRKRDSFCPKCSLLDYYFRILSTERISPPPPTLSNVSRGSAKAVPDVLHYFMNACTYRCSC
eukprot:scaffold5190_cov92-Skeletonema_dohrnii-CCMP3373.AAC.9